MSTYISKIFTKGEIVVEYLQGFITWADVIEMKKLEALKPDYNPDYNLITDIRDVEIDMDDLEGMKEYIAFFKYNEKAVGIRKTAILTQSSKQVIHSEMLKLMTNHLPMDLKTVSTYDGAFQWIGLNQFTRVEIRNYLENLRRDNLRLAANL